MDIELIDATRKSWPVSVDLPKATWTTTVELSANTPFSLFARGNARRNAAGDIVLLTGLWDIVLENAPRTDHDAARSKGSVRVENCQVGPWTRGMFSWAQRSAGTGVDKNTKGLPKRTGSLRNDIVATVRAVMPCSLGDDNWDLIEPGSEKQVAEKTYSKPGTSCLILPGFISRHFGAVPYGWAFKGTKRVDEVKNYMNKRSLSGTNQVRTRGKSFNAWTQATGNNLPRPGDIYVLLDRDAKGAALTQRDTDGVGHVGVVLNAGNSSWETADLGQGTGWVGNISPSREYHAGIGELFGQTNQPGATKFRVVAGWVDVDRYFPDYAQQVLG